MDGLGEDAAASHVFRWHGGENALLDTVDIMTCGRIVVGRYGGARAGGATSNEDGALVWCEPSGQWEFAAVVDAHYSPESAALILDALEAIQANIISILAQPPETAFAGLHAQLVVLFASPSFRQRASQVTGEASCLICVRKGRYLWWLSVGDCLGYTGHPELAALGQYLLNQRVYFQWIGARNTFDQPVPCYTTGTLCLLPGTTLLALATDGLFEGVPSYYTDPATLLDQLRADDVTSLSQAVHTALRAVHNAHGRDGATLLAWAVSVAG